MNIIQKKVKDYWNEKTLRFEKINELAFSEEALLAAYQSASKAKGATTKGGEDTTLDGMSLERIKNLSKELMSGTWKPGKARRVMIQKKDLTKLRPLTILSADDKIVCYAIKSVLEPIYEGTTEIELADSKKFQPTSHGYRPGRGVHSALRRTLTWGLVSWFSKVDVKRYYDTIHQNRLINIIEERVNDQVLTDTIRKLFNMEVINLSAVGPDTKKGKGIPQGSPLSPLLANIYLDKLDIQMKELAEVNNKGERVKPTENWNRAVYVSASELGKTKGSKRRSLQRQLYRKKVKEAHRKSISKYGRNDEEQKEKVFHRVYYVRYADDFLVGVRGPKELARKVITVAAQLLKSDLQLEVDSVKIYDARNNKVEFLGFEIKSPGRSERAVVENRKIIAFKKLRARVTNRTKEMQRRTERMIQKLVDEVRNRKVKELANLKLTKEQLRAEAEKIATKELYETLDAEKGNPNLAIRWASDELNRLTDSYIAKKELESLNLLNIVDQQKQLQRDMLEAIGGKALANLKMEEVNRARSENKPKRTIDRILYGQAQGLSPRLYIPMQQITEKIRGWGMLAEGKRVPKANGIVLKYHDAAIIEFYKNKAKGLLEYYKPGNNLHELKKTLDYHMRYSLLHTLAAKHKKKLHQIIEVYGKTPILYVKGKAENAKPRVLAKYLTPAEINTTTRGHNLKEDPITYHEGLDKPIAKLSIPRMLFEQCSVKGCENTDIEIHHIRKLQRRIRGFVIQSVQTKTKENNNPLQIIESSLHRKQIPLCKAHHCAMHKNEITIGMLDKKVLNQNVTILGHKLTPVNK